MAASIAHNYYMQNTLLVANNDVCTTLRTQGLTDFGDYAVLNEEDIADICTNVRKPGGTINNPNHDPAKPVAGVPETIPNPGYRLDL
jgi:hypothetical protein